MKTCKKIFNVVLGIWCGVTCFISPIWLALIFLNISGLIYKYDYSMDEGTATIVGIIYMVLWILFVLLPNVAFIKKMYSIDKKYLTAGIVSIILLWVLCLAMCGWDIIGFLTTPGTI